VLLRLDSLSRTLGGRAVVDGLSFDVSRGEIFGLLGPNGAGKSTTFRLLTGLLEPDAGAFYFQGVQVYPTQAAFRAHLGVVFQHPSVDVKLTGRENLRLGATLHRLGRDLAKERIEEALALADLGERADEPVEHYSGGMRRRLELARVLMARPLLLIMDEPGAGLDQASLRRFWNHLERLRDETRVTILVTTHQPEEAERCDRLAILSAGKLVAQGSPEALRKQVGGDMLILEGAADEPPEKLAREVAELMGVAAKPFGQQVRFEHPRAHELIPRIVEKLPPGRLRSVSVRQPTLADVFVQLTGQGLDVDQTLAPAGGAVPRAAGRVESGRARTTTKKAATGGW
jgi:ABC-2 type transport system ATP-binding protein